MRRALSTGATSLRGRTLGDAVECEGSEERGQPEADRADTQGDRVEHGAGDARAAVGGGVSVLGLRLGATSSKLAGAPPGINAKSKE